MRTMTMNYPGDPTETVTIYTVAEFLKAYPRFPIRVIADGVLVSETPVPENEIDCDHCNKQITDGLIHVACDHAYCEECTKTLLLPYCKEATS